MNIQFPTDFYLLSRVPRVLSDTLSSQSTIEPSSVGRETVFRLDGELSRFCRSFTTSRTFLFKQSVKGWSFHSTWFFSFLFSLRSTPLFRPLVVSLRVASLRSFASQQRNFLWKPSAPFRCGCSVGYFDFGCSRTWKSSQVNLWNGDLLNERLPVPIQTQLCWDLSSLIERSGQVDEIMADLNSSRLVSFLGTFLLCKKCSGVKSESLNVLQKFKVPELGLTTAWRDAFYTFSQRFSFTFDRNPWTILDLEPEIQTRFACEVP